MLALNLVDTSLPELLLPLEYGQVAPLGFLIVQAVIVGIFGSSEYVLRLFPLICGIASLLLFPRVARHALGAAPALIIATALFATSYKLIFYASNVKQYSSDVAITLALYALTHRTLSAGLSLRTSVAFGIAGAIAIWFSHPAMFILAGIGATLAGLFAHRKAWASLRRVVMAGALWAFSFGIFYVVSLRKLPRPEGLLDYWAGGFMPVPPRTLSELRWFDETFFRFFREPLGLFPVSLACTAFLVGCISLVSQRKDQFLLLGTPVLWALIASALHVYPFSDRLLLFAAPFAIIAIAEGLIRFGDMAQRHRLRVSAAAALLLVVPQVVYSSAIFFRPYSFEEVRPAIAYISQHWQSGDLVYVYPPSRPTFRYYSTRYGFEAGEYVLGHSSRNDLAGLRRELEAAGRRKRLWVLFSHIDYSDGVDDDSLFRAQISPQKALADSFKQTNAAAYLYVERP
jgi:hypothetical protein